MKAWLLGILFGGFFGFTISILVFFLELMTYEEESKHILLLATQLIIVFVFGWVAWRAEGVQTLVGYVLGSFYLVRLMFHQDKQE